MKVLDPAGRFHSDGEIVESEVPENVRLIIEGRMERAIRDKEKTVLAAAAVMGRRLDFQLLGAPTGCPRATRRCNVN